MGRLRAKVRRTPLEPDSSTGVEEEIVMRLKGKRVAILAENMYQEMELWVPYYRLQEEGPEVKVVGTGAKSYTSKMGYSVSADVSAEEVTAAHFDGVILPGGYAPDMMRRSPAMVRLVKDAFLKGKVVAGARLAARVRCSGGGGGGENAAR